jgi:hypothetical protein
MDDPLCVRFHYGHPDVFDKARPDARMMIMIMMMMMMTSPELNASDQVTVGSQLTMWVVGLRSADLSHHAGVGVQGQQGRQPVRGGP